MRLAPPIAEELQPAPDVEAALLAFADWPDVILLDSAQRRGELGRYSFLSAEPRTSFVVDRAEPGCDPLAPLRAAFAEFEAAGDDSLPPFQGGIAGLLSYELGAAWERLPTAAHNEFAMPVLAAGLYDWVLAWDHAAGRAWIIVQPWAERPRERLAAVRETLQRGEAKTIRPWTSGGESVLLQAPRAALPGHSGVSSNFSRAEYLSAVARVIEYIRAGDVFQANLSQRLVAAARCSPLELYARLRRHNPAPFAGYFAHDDWAVLSSSPERFMRLEGSVVETRPIKGTRQRRATPEADLFTRDELRESGKDRAENVMIVDLLRNDLSRVCRPQSVRVSQLCEVETYQTVQHLVSEVRGELREGCDFFDLLSATFPGGSITGAPKVRAMEIITELEGVARGPYCGSLFYVGCNGRADSSILIRTLVHRGGWVSCGVGGGIVSQSDPAAEYDETLHKAAGMLRALT